MSFRPRLTAALLHACVCLAIAIVVVVVVVGFWYQWPLLLTVDGVRIVGLLVGVDLILGPTLTFVVFTPGKRGLMLDLVVIAVVQLSALVYGLVALYGARPVFVAFTGARFEVVQSNQLDRRELRSAGVVPPYWRPDWIATRRDERPDVHAQIMLEAMQGRDYALRPQYYVTLGSVNASVLAASRPVAELRLLNVERDGQISSWLKRHNLAESAVRFLPLKAPTRDMAVIVQSSDGVVVAIAPFTPW